jgi:hypothetical protein
VAQTCEQLSSATIEAENVLRECMRRLSRWMDS